MRVHVVCGYRSKSDGWTEKWTDADFRARNLVKALKRETFNGFSEWQVTATKQTLRVDNTPAGQTMALRLALSKLFDLFAKAGIEEARVVPVPSSKTVAPGDGSTGSRLVTAIAGIKPTMLACPVLFFNEPQPKTADSGSRRWQDILPHLRGKVPAGGGPIILLDDVMTSGGHLRACARFFAERGESVNDAFVVGRTVWERPESMFQMPVETLSL